MADLKRYKDFAPTSMDASGLNGERHGIADFYVVASVNRDSGALERSNFRVMLRDAEANDVDHEVHRFGHWACGWLDLLLCRDDDKGTAFATTWGDALADYPVADDNDLSETENDDKRQSWESWARRDVVRIVETTLRAVDLDTIGVDVDGLADASEDLEAYQGNGDDTPGSYSERELQRIAARVVKHVARWISRPCDPRAVKRHMRGVALWR